jgi:hypothetical protein
MNHHLKSLLIGVAAITLFGSIATADTPKELKTEKGKSVVLGTFVNAPSNCSSNPGPNPVPVLYEKPSHGVVSMQIVMADVAASDSCPARKMPAIALFYIPHADFVGIDSVRVEFETGATKMPALSFRITVEAAESK